MKEIIYEDCNNNIQFIKEMFLKIGLMVKEELMWNISNFDSVPVNSEDYEISIFDGDIISIQGNIEDFL